MKIRTLSLFLGIFLASLVSVYSQVGSDNSSVLEPGEDKGVIYLGPTFGYNKSIHSYNIVSFESKDAPCPTFDQGNDNGYHLGFNLQIPFSSVNSKHSIIVRGLYSSLPSNSKVVSNTNLGSHVTDPNSTEGKDYFTDTRHVLEVDYKVASVDVMYAFKPMQDLGFVFTIGPTFDFALTKKKTQKMELLSTDPNVRFKDKNVPGQPVKYEYENDYKTLIVGGKNSDIDESNAFRLGFKVGAHYDISVEKVLVCPYIMYDMGVTKLASGSNWRVNALMIGVDVRFSIKSPF